MSILYDEGQGAIASEAQRILQARASKDRALGLLESEGAFDTVFWNTAVEQGWTGVAIPEEYGGLGLGLVELGIVAQACGGALSGAPFLTTGYGATRALLAAGSEDLRARFLRLLASGEALAAVALGEAEAILPPSPAVVFEQGALTGLKEAVVAGLGANFAIVWASAQGQPALALAELDGVTRRPVQSFDNSRLYADIEFNRTPAQLIAQGEAARKLAVEVLAHMAVVTAHEQTGGAEFLLRTGCEYANTRRAFGQPIAAFQSVKHRLAEIYALIEISRANCIHAAAQAGEEDFIKAAAAARLTATEAYDVAARDVIQVHGGIGATWEAGLHLHQRRTRSLAIEQGNLLFWEDVLAEQLTGVAA